MEYTPEIRQFRLGRPDRGYGLNKFFKFQRRFSSEMKNII